PAHDRGRGPGPGCGLPRRQGARRDDGPALLQHQDDAVPDARANGGAAMTDRPAVDLAALDLVARRIRGRVIAMSHHAGTPHLGPSLSCVAILVAAYWGVLDIDPRRPDDPNRDRFILSKGHAAPALYAALAYRGFFPPERLDAFAEAGGALAEQPSPGCAPG